MDKLYAKGISSKLISFSPVFKPVKDLAFLPFLISRFYAFLQFWPPDLVSCNKFLSFCFIHEPYGQSRASIRTSGLLPAAIQQMSTTGAFLSDVQTFIEEDDIIRTGIDTVL